MYQKLFDVFGVIEGYITGKRLLIDFIIPYLSPSVAKGRERFRINVTPNHTEEQMDLFVDSVVFVFDQLKIKRSEN